MFLFQLCTYSFFWLDNCIQFLLLFSVLCGMTLNLEFGSSFWKTLFSNDVSLSSSTCTDLFVLFITPICHLSSHILLFSYAEKCLCLIQLTSGLELHLARSIVPFRKIYKGKRRWSFLKKVAYKKHNGPSGSDDSSQQIGLPLYTLIL